MPLGRRGQAPSMVRSPRAGLRLAHPLLLQVAAQDLELEGLDDAAAPLQKSSSSDKAASVKRRADSPGLSLGEPAGSTMAARAASDPGR